MERMAFAWLPINLRLINSIWRLCPFFSLLPEVPGTVSLSLAPSLCPYLVSCSLICWRVTDSFGELLVIDFVLPHVSAVLWSRERERSRREEGCLEAWEAPRTAQRTLALIIRNYSNCIWSDPFGVAWQLSWRTFFSQLSVALPLSPSLSHSLWLLLFLFSFLFCFFPVLLKSFCWSVARILCDFSQERHEHKHFWCASTQTIHKHTHSHTPAHTCTACAHLKTLVKDSYRIRTH